MQASKRISLLKDSLPHVLIVQLKRFSSLGVKINTPVKFPIDLLDLQPFVANASERDHLNYRLCAVTEHTGVCGGGHYTAYARCIDGVWRYFNDAEVTRPSHLSESIYTDAYLLFYERVKVREPHNSVI